MNKYILRKLHAAGLDAKPVKLTGNKNGIMVYHDYFGLYPNAETMRKHNAVENIARAAGLRSEQRGHYSATLIYC